MSSIHTALRDFDALDALALQASPLARLDPRAKILATLAFIGVVLSYDRYSVAALLPYALFPLLLASWGGISLRLMARQVLLASPFAVMVGLFNPWLDPQAQVHLLGYPVAGGWLSFASILLRFCLTVSAALVLVASTGLPRICCGLRHMGMPQVFTTQLFFLHRYAMLLAGEAARMCLARELRGSSRGGLPLAVYASLLGHLLVRAMARAQRIYQAMLSRGFTGDMPATQALHWQRQDGFFLLLCCSSFVLLRQADGVHGLGRWLMRWLV